jgi:hypothetical protein
MSSRFARKQEATMIQNDARKRDIRALAKRVAKLEKDTAWETSVMRQMIDFTDEVATLNKRLERLMALEEKPIELVACGICAAAVPKGLTEEHLGWHMAASMTCHCGDPACKNPMKQKPLRKQAVRRG